MAFTLATVAPAEEKHLRGRDPWRSIPAGADVVRTAAGFEFVTYDSCVALLRHTGLGTGLRELFESVGVTDEVMIRNAETSVNGAEGPDHMRLRAAIGSFLTPSRIEGLRSEVRVMIEDLLDRAGTAGGFDIVDTVLRHIPARFFAILLGVPLTDSDFITYVSDSVVKVFSMDPDAKEDVEAAQREADDWVERIVADGREDADNLIGHLLRQQRAGSLTLDEVHNAISIMLAASTETTQGLMVHIVAAFADHPDQWDLVRADPSLVPGAVIEVARWNPASIPTFRVALEDVDIDGIRIPQGAHAFAVVMAANRDPKVFDAADAFDVTRKAPRQPLNWSVGRHFCMGRMAAVMECEELIRAMSSRWRRIERVPLTAVGEPEFFAELGPLRVRVTPA